MALSPFSLARNHKKHKPRKLLKALHGTKANLIEWALLGSNARATDGNARRHSIAGNHPIGKGDIPLQCSVAGGRINCGWRALKSHGPGGIDLIIRREGVSGTRSAHEISQIAITTRQSPRHHRYDKCQSSFHNTELFGKNCRPLERLNLSPPAVKNDT